MSTNNLPASDACIAVARRFFQEFGPTHADMVATARRLCHDNLRWDAPGYAIPVDSLDRLISDLDRAKDLASVGGMTFDIRHIAATGNVALMERLDRIHDAEGNVVHELKVMGIMCVEDGKIRWAKDYFFDTREFFASWGGGNVHG